LKRFTWTPNSSPTQRTTSSHPTQQNIISVGIFSTVHCLEGTIVRKVPTPSDTGDFLGNCNAIRNEAQIYNLLGNHPCIAECLSMGQTEDHVDLRYYKNGTLLEYLKRDGEKIDNARQRQWRWGQQIVEAVVLIHKYGIIHSDLALRQYLLDDQLNARLSDFGASAFRAAMRLGSRTQAIACLEILISLIRSCQICLHLALRSMSL
jgi:serine/threonine protein kinase